MNFRTKPPLRAVVGVFGIAILTNAWAGDQLDEVIVTAEKRSESLQTVPLSITAIGAEALQERAVVDFFDYGTKIPNLGFGYTGDGIGTSRTISIRGISGDNVTSIYLDETPLPDSIDPRILDIDHIEVLRGPQVRSTARARWQASCASSRSSRIRARSMVSYMPKRRILGIRSSRITISTAQSMFRWSMIMPRCA